MPPSDLTENTNLLPEKQQMHRPLNPSSRSMLRLAAFAILGVFLLISVYNLLSSSPVTSGDEMNEVVGGTMSSSGEHMVGGDRDDHGCIGSAGYTYCAGLRKCVRPWEINMGMC
ncbi:hypothetical protein TrLO_g1167 [Triparma laevis f. longispina]|uniref:Uncharacterized protein n=1 Tax=Triparma laevis f. longispina TaxID=1714387 RepID=A0A9W7FKB7_9STRA|nr:hypothetical protein TrLO_g1167 [Triparma laevis f. longispina]